MLVAVGWWPHDIEFDHRDMATVIDILNKGTKR